MEDSKIQNILKVMEEDWDLRGKTNAPFFTCSKNALWDLNEYYTQGTREVDLFIKDVVGNWGLDPKGKRMLEIGCGIGRQTRGLSRMFAEVYGIDISNAMITKAKELNGHLKNVKFIKTNGQDLKDFPDDYFDFVYSFTVFQHIPDKRIISNYFQETYRVLKIGGLFKIHLHERLFIPNWSFAYGFIPIPYFIFSRLPYWILKLYYAVPLRKKGYRPTGIRAVWGSGSLTRDELTQMLQDSHLTLLDLFEEESYQKSWDRWCVGQKKC